MFQLIQRCIKAGATRSWSRHQKYERKTSISLCLCLFSSLLLNWPVVEIYSVLCTSHCVVFYNVPPLMGTGPWEGAFNQQEIN